MLYTYSNYTRSATRAALHFIIARPLPASNLHNSAPRLLHCSAGSCSLDALCCCTLCIIHCAGARLGQRAFALLCVCRSPVKGRYHVEHSSSTLSLWVHSARAAVHPSPLRRVRDIVDTRPRHADTMTGRARARTACNKRHSIEYNYAGHPSAIVRRGEPVDDRTTRTRLSSFIHTLFSHTRHGLARLF